MPKTTTPNPLRPEPVTYFRSLNGTSYPSKLECLLNNKRVALRGIIQSHRLGKSPSFTPNDIIVIINDCGPELLKTIQKMDRAIQKEMGIQKEICKQPIN